jgi:YfiH family protein
MLQARLLTSLPGIRHGFFTREGGVSDGVRPDRFLTCYQIHSPEVVVAETSWTHEQRPRADAIVTKTPQLAIGVSTADCGPVLMADPEARVIGATHAGWRGALTGVIEATIAAMEKLGAKRSRIVAALGPMIRQPSYEVGQDLIDRFVAVQPNNVRFFKPATRPGHAMFDLAGFIVSRLRRAEIAQIEDLGHCTYADPAQFYSYRRSTHLAEPDYGRHINAIALVD